MDIVKKMLYETADLMRRDYLSCLNFFLGKNNDNYHSYYEIIDYIYDHITDIDVKDVDLMIENNWIDLIKKFDGYSVECSYNSNIDSDDKYLLKKYKFDITKMKNKYIERIKNKEEINPQLKDVTVLIDGANMGHLSGKFDFKILPSIIMKCKKAKLNPKIILHERHILEGELKTYLEPYLIRTPIHRNDDDYMIYGMLVNDIMVVSNDMFRDHLKNMDLYTKCYVRSMTIKYFNNNLIIPKHSRCIQVNEDKKIIFIPGKNGFYKIHF